MNIRYISTTGSDSSGDGTIGMPYSSIEKCLLVGNDGDIINVMDGTYSINTVINITKRVTITSNSELATGVVFDSTSTIFNIQSSNVVISYLTLQTNNDSLVSIDRFSDGTEVPTFFTGISINNCNIKYVSNAMTLNGSFSVNNNTFTRISGTSVANVIKILTCRDICSISGNTFTDAEPLQNVLYFTSIGSGFYSDICNSKGGSFTIAGNNINYENNDQIMTFMYFDHFNKYTTITSDYNLNTKVSLIINNNTITSTKSCRFIYLNIQNNMDCSMFSECIINDNSIDNTDYGIIHLGKDSTSTVVNLTSLMPFHIFKIYSNTLSTIVELFPFIYNNTIYKPNIWLRSKSGIASSNSLISSWTDVIDNRVATAYKSGATNYPTIDMSEGFPFVKIGSGYESYSDGNYFNFGQTIQYPSAFSFIGVVRVSNRTNFQRLFSINSGPSQDITIYTDLMLINSQISDRFTFVWFGASPIVIAETFNSYPNNTWIVIGLTINASTVKYYMNTTTPYTININNILTNFTPDNTIIGYTPHGETYSNIDIREYMFYNRTVASTDMSTMIGLLKTEYSI
jgi:hypothetical protein